MRDIHMRHTCCIVTIHNVMHAACKQGDRYPGAYELLDTMICVRSLVVQETCPRNKTQDPRARVRRNEVVLNCASSKSLLVWRWTRGREPASMRLLVPQTSRLGMGAITLSLGVGRE